MSKKIKLDQLKVKSFVTKTEPVNAETIKGGYISFGDPCTTNEPEFCNWTRNRWCYSNGCNTWEALCTVPK
ncbi:MAG: pinensin family lanthipeptide [Cyclobacteriaceae bacterium]